MDKMKKLKELSDEYWSLVPNERFYDSLEEMIERRDEYITELEKVLFAEDVVKLKDGNFVIERKVK